VDELLDAEAQIYRLIVTDNRNAEAAARRSRNLGH
jgi:hypothetical protein